MTTLEKNICAVILLAFAVLFFACDDDKSSTGPDNGNAPTIAGTIIGSDAASITHVGLFQQGGDDAKVVDLDKDNAAPVKITTAGDSSWSLTMPGSPDNWDMFVALGWNDADGDGRFDPESGETSASCYQTIDSYSSPYFWYFSSADTNHVAGWNVQLSFGGDTEDLDDHLNGWLIKAGEVISIYGNWNSIEPYNDFNAPNVLKVTNEELVIDWTDEAAGDVHDSIVEYIRTSSRAILQITQHSDHPEQVGMYNKIEWTFPDNDHMDLDVYALSETRDGAYDESDLALHKGVEKDFRLVTCDFRL